MRIPALHICKIPHISPMTGLLLTNIRPTIKKLLVCCAPTYPPKLALPKKIYGHFEENIFFLKKSKNKDSFSQTYSFQNLFSSPEPLGSQGELIGWP